jgi:hypothetical protein
VSTDSGPTFTLIDQFLTRGPCWRSGLGICHEGLLRRGVLSPAI